MSPHPPVTAVRTAVARALAEDLEPLGDLTAALLAPGIRAVAALVARAPGLVAGRLAAEEAFRQVDPAIEVDWIHDDGSPVESGTTVAHVSGPAVSVLTAERTALNFLGHLSGIATLTRAFVEAAAQGGPARIWDTRKTTPGLRALEKAAVRAGGGANHRGNLSEWVLLKDNHLAGIGIAEAVARARTLWPGRTVEVEADRRSQVREAIAAGADLVLLDNMTPGEVARCVAERGGARRPLLEASGGVTLANVADYAGTGV
ncbi:MAG: carboxylating nicotinate-nucleotide diphosphorylase, partial [Actinomycetota bacterium]|nr:carboxylating nicotinate-nucleotide diphosphorylase [Actinomycetota bacterium]